MNPLNVILPNGVTMGFGSQAEADEWHRNNANAGAISQEQAVQAAGAPIQQIKDVLSDYWYAEGNPGWLANRQAQGIQPQQNQGLLSQPQNGGGLLSGYQPINYGNWQQPQAAQTSTQPGLQPHVMPGPNPNSPYQWNNMGQASWGGGQDFATVTGNWGGRQFGQPANTSHSFLWSA